MDRYGTRGEWRPTAYFGMIRNVKFSNEKCNYSNTQDGGTQTVFSRVQDCGLTSGQYIII